MTIFFDNVEGTLVFYLQFKPLIRILEDRPCRSYFEDPKIQRFQVIFKKVKSPVYKDSCLKNAILRDNYSTHDANYVRKFVTDLFAL